MSFSGTLRSWERYLSLKPSFFACTSRSSGGSVPLYERIFSSSSTSSRIWSTKYAFTPVRLKICSSVAPLRSASYIWKWRSEFGIASILRSSSRLFSWKSFAKPRPARPFSSARIAFWSVSLYVLPMDITSPTAFICVPRWSSTARNFSNAQRANLRTM